MGNGHVPKKKIPGSEPPAHCDSSCLGGESGIRLEGLPLFARWIPRRLAAASNGRSDYCLGRGLLGSSRAQGRRPCRQGYAPLVLFSGALYRGRPEGEFAVSYLVQLGYSPTLFAVFPQAADSTIAEAVALRGELARRHVKRAIIVTSNYHSRRAAIVLHLFCPGIDFISIPAFDSHYHPQLWWRDPGSRQIFFSEWTKIFGSVLIAYPSYLVRLRGG